MEYSKLWALLKAPVPRAGDGSLVKESEAADLTDTTIHNALAASGESSADAVYELVLSGSNLNSLGDCRGELSSALTRYTSIRKLVLNSNALTEIHPKTTVQPLGELRELQMDFNRLDALPSFPNPKLETLSAAHNRITDFPVLALPKLATLDVSQNQIVLPDSPISGLRLPQLVSLDISGNRITSLKALAGLTHITTLNVSSNQLASLAGIEGMVNLEELNASRNKLRNQALLQHSNPLRAAGRKLEVLDLSYNEISTLQFFPGGGAMGKVWSLNVGHNRFGNAPAAEESDTPAPTKGASSKTLRGPRKASNASSASAPPQHDDIGDAAYDGDDVETASVSSKASSVAKAKTGRAGSRAPSTTPSLRRGPSSTRSSKAESDDGTTPAATSANFSQRIATLFPEVEVLDVSFNDISVLPTYDDLKGFAKCQKLAELRLSGTLGPGSAKLRGRTIQDAAEERKAVECSPEVFQRHAAAVKSLLPDLDVLDTHTLRDVKAPLTGKAALQLMNMDAVDRPSSAASAPSRPQSAAARPESASVLRPGTAGGDKKVAVGAAKATAEFTMLRDELAAFLARTTRAQERCHRIVDHMQASVAWAYGNAAPPPEVPDLRDLDEEALNAKAAEEERAEREREEQELSDLEDELEGDGTTLVVHGAEKGKPPAPQQATPPRPTVPKARPEGTPSPQSKRIAAASSRSASAHSPGSSDKQLISELGPIRSGSSHRRPSSNRSASVTYNASASRSNFGGSETEAMKRVKANPSTSFVLEQAKFKADLRREADSRRAELMRMTGAAPKPMKTLLEGPQGKKVTAESGTSTVSPDKSGRQQRGRASHPADAPRAVATSTTSTATSPQQDPQLQAYLLRKRQLAVEKAEAEVQKEKDAPAPVPQSSKSEASTTTKVESAPEVRRELNPVDDIPKLNMGEINVGNADDDSEDEDAGPKESNGGGADNTNDDDDDDDLLFVSKSVHPDGQPKGRTLGDDPRTATEIFADAAAVDPRDMLGALRPSSASQSDARRSSAQVVTATSGQVVLGGQGLVLARGGQNSTEPQGSRPGSAGSSTRPAGTQSLLKEAFRAGQPTALRKHDANRQPSDAERRSAALIKQGLASQVEQPDDVKKASSARKPSDPSPLTTDSNNGTEAQETRYFEVTEKPLRATQTKKKAGASLNRRF